MKPTCKYDDIIHLPRHISDRHSPMSNADRAAQFSPFAALTGYDGVIAETGRLTSGQIELDEDEIARLDGMLRYIRDHLSQLPRVRLTVFRPDARKAGGAYEEITGKVKKIDEYQRCLILTDGAVIPIGQIYGIDCQL